MARIRSSTNAFGRLLTASDRPVYVLDDQRKYLFLNAACGRWLQIDEETLLGAQANYHSGPATADTPTPVPFANLLCPPPDAFFGKDCYLHLELRLPDGSITRRDVQFVALKDQGSQVAGIIGIVSAHEVESSQSRQAHRHVTAEAADLHTLLMSARQHIGTSFFLPALIGESTAIQRAQQQLQAASAVQVSTTIIGPAGSGREALARRVHLQQGSQQSTQRQLGNQHAVAQPGPLVPLSCELLDAELLQSTIRELNLKSMEHEHDFDGTLLMLNVEQLSPEAQTELLGFLLLPSFSLNIIATSNQSLIEIASSGGFSAELANLLSAIEITIPPLTRRRQDIPLILQWLLEHVNARGNRQLSGFARTAMDVLVAYSWPGDVEEATQLVLQLHGESDGPEIEVDALPKHLKWAIEDRSATKASDEFIQLDEFLEEVEEELIRRALAASRGNKAQAARSLGVSRPRLIRRVSHFGLD